ncbi:anti-sigma factor [uncultured Psychroserpens sp.]|uniref:anti-sigma factor n=1 Tax=uncultured Psychroserpens sp. TaxID=255436 RepID=UPI00262FC6E7|nr:anti-sigma factor [uncultured Psychroserpens sp.]
MMDKAYILDNGILELYVLGELSESDQQQVDTAISQYPELQSHLDAIEESFEKMAFENAIDIPVNIKSELLNTISNTTTKTVSIAPQKSLRSYLNIAASITVLLLIGSVYMYSQLNSTKKRLEVVEQENAKLNSNIENLNNYLSETNKWYVAINDPDVQKYVLTGNAMMPEATVISYVNNIDKSVVINTKYLPKLDDDHDYQMWADVEGEMINMGVIDKSKDMLAMNYIDNAESLNITIEPAGGNDHPTVSQLITNVYLQ